MRVVLVAAVSAVLLAACGKDSDDSGSSGPPPPEECPPDSAVTWDSFAEGWMDTWCTGCHSATLEGLDRQGAPDTVNFDTYEQVIQFGERIRLLATGDDPYMPPTGGTQAGDRELLAEWIACGMPGGDDPALGCQLAPVVGDTQLGDQATADALCADGLLRVDGDLDITGAEVLASCVCAVSGTVTVQATGFAAPELVEVGEVAVDGASWLVLSELVDVSGSVRITGTNVAELTLPELQSVGADFSLSGNALLATVDLPRLAWVGGDFAVEDNDTLGDLDNTLAIDHVGGQVRIEDNAGLATVYAFRFATDLHDVVIRRNAELAYLGGFELQAALTGELVVEDNDALRRMEAFNSLVDLDGSLSIQGNAVFEQLGGFDNLATVSGDLSLVDNPALPTVDATDFAAGVAVGGTTTVSGNAP